MAVHDEGRVRFTFDDREWPMVLKWDAHPAYRNGLGRVAGTKATDFIGLHTLGPWLIEVKDFRAHRIENRGRVGDDLAEEIASKVRDTLAGAIWACVRVGLEQAAELPRCIKALLNAEERSQSIRILVWLDQDGPFQPAAATAFEEQIKRKLRPWLRARVHVTATGAWDGSGLTGANLAGAGRRR